MPDDLQVGLIKLVGLQGLLQIANQNGGSPKINLSAIGDVLTVNNAAGQLAMKIDAVGQILFPSSGQQSALLSLGGLNVKDKFGRLAALGVNANGPWGQIGVIEMNGLTGMIVIKSNEKPGLVLDGSKIELWAQTGDHFFKIDETGISLNSGSLNFRFNGKNALSIFAGTFATLEAINEIKVKIKDATNSLPAKEIVTIDQSKIKFNGSLVVNGDTIGRETIELNNNGRLKIGGTNGGEISLEQLPLPGQISAAPKRGVWMSARNGQIQLMDSGGAINLDLNASEKKLSVANKVLIDGGNATVGLRGDSIAEMIRLDGRNNAIVLRNKANKDTVWIHADPSNGGSGIHLRNKDGNEMLVLDGEAGDIILQNADCAEEFDIAETDLNAEPGTVMVLNDHGKLCQSFSAFDKRVAGVISGAGDYRPGIILDRQQSDKRRLPLALVGKVFCKVDASFGAIQVGDLLTTSSTIGHAMRTDDPLKAFGAVLGKALKPLPEGCGLIPILVALQ